MHYLRLSAVEQHWMTPEMMAEGLEILSAIPSSTKEYKIIQKLSLDSHNNRQKNSTVSKQIKEYNVEKAVRELAGIIRIYVTITRNLVRQGTSKL